MTTAYVTIPPPTTPEAHEGYTVGTEIHIALGDDKGRTGHVIGWGRDAATDVEYQLDADPERLVNQEGPVVRFGDGEEHWYPGQAMGLLDLVTPEPAPAG
jgi:hypothetical protein